MNCRIVMEHDRKTGDWAVWCPEVPGCVPAGETQEAAEANTREAIQLNLQAMPLTLEACAVVKQVTVK